MFIWQGLSMYEIGKIYQAPTVSFLVYESLHLAMLASQFATKKSATTKWHSSETSALTAATYWTYKLNSLVSCTKWYQPMLLIDKKPYENEIFCFILTGENLGWISYNVEGEVYFQTLQPKT